MMNAVSSVCVIQIFTSGGFCSYGFFFPLQPDLLYYTLSLQTSNFANPLYSAASSSKKSKKKKDSEKTLLINHSDDEEEI